MIGQKIIHFDEIDSTNTYIKNNYKTLDSGTIVTAKHQTKGYGRKERTWFDQDNANLMFSLYIKTEISDTLPLLTQLVAASVTKALHSFHLNAKIKWPNDILINGKKICGILVETIIEHQTAHIVIGVGLNVNNTTFEPSIESIATSMFKESHKIYELSDVLHRVIEKLGHFYLHHQKKDYNYIVVCRKFSYLIGKTVTLETGESAYVKDIDQLGKLVVEINGETKSFSGSEVTLHHTYKS